MGAGKGNKERRSNTVLYKVKDSASLESKNKLDKILKKYKLNDRKRKLGKGVKQATSKNKIGKTEEELSEEIISSGAVEYAEPDYLVAPNAEPNDTFFKYQWHLNTINAPQAWDSVTGNSQVKVLVCDTGINSSHPDLSQLLSLPGKNFVDGSSNTEPIHYHGTAVAGTMSGYGNNGKGISGVTWNVKIIPGKISNASSGSAYYSDMAECITYGGDQGAKVVNLSYRAYQSSTIDSAAAYLKNRGGLVFIAAGNDSQDVSSFLDSENSIVVGSTTSSNARSSFSNYGKPIDLFAPGSSIFATNLSGYGRWSGTSAASPVAAGAAALLFSYDPNLSPEQVETALFETATDLGKTGDDDMFGHGLVNVDAALISLQGGQVNSPPQAIINVDKTVGDAPLTLYFDGINSIDTDGSIVSYEWTFPGNVKSTLASPSFTFNNSGVQTVTLKVTDNSGATDMDNILISVNAVVEKPAPQAIIQADKTEGQVPLTVNFTGSSSTDSDGSIVSYEWTFPGNVKSYQANPSFVFNEPGVQSVILKVTDDDGASDEASILVTVNIADVNSPPQAMINADKTQGFAPLSVQFDGSNSSDSDGSIVSYEWNFPGNVKSAEVSPSFTFINTGAQTVSLKVTDDDGAINETSVVINVNAQETNSSPVAVINVNKTTGTAPEVLYFDGTNSTDSDGSVVSYEWTFPGNVKNYEPKPSFNFTSVGVQKVILKVSDDKGATGSSEILITINGESSPSLHVNTISLSKRYYSSLGYRVTAKVQVLDNNNQPVRYAFVYGSFSGAINEPGSYNITNSRGEAKVMSNWNKTSGTVTFSVNDIQKNEYIYDSSLNMESSGSIILP